MNINCSTTSNSKTNKEKQVAALLDVQGYWHNEKNDIDMLRKRISDIYDMGIRNVIVVTANPGFSSYTCTSAGPCRQLSSFWENVERYNKKGYELPEFAFPELCHEKGMKCYASFKPYEGGGMESVPLDAKCDSAIEGFPERLGKTIHLENFLKENLKKGIDYRVARRPDGANDDLGGNIDAITVDYITEGFSQRGEFDPRTMIKEYCAVDPSVIRAADNGEVYTNERQHPVYGINIWVSDTNGRYSLYNGSYTYSYKAGKKVLYDANGDAMFGGKSVSTLTLTVTGLSIKERFCAVSFDSTAGMRTDPLSWVHIFRDGKEMPSSKADFVRSATRVKALEKDGVPLYRSIDASGNISASPDPAEYVWGHDRRPAAYGCAVSLKLGEDGFPKAAPSSTDKFSPYGFDDTYSYIVEHFYLFGFAFNFEDYPGLVLENTSVIGIGRGKPDTFVGGLCEAYPQVREYWLDHTKKLIDAGFDGVLVRLQSHSSCMNDFKNYGYNPPILERYRELYGEKEYSILCDPNHTVSDDEYFRIMKIRGDFFTEYAEEASKICHANGTEFSVLMREAYSDPIISPNQNEVTWWTMPKILFDWKHMVNLSDSVVVKDYIHSPDCVQDCAKAIREYAKSVGKKSWIECYDEQAGMINTVFLGNVVEDDAIDGVIIYEMTNTNHYIETGLKKTLKDSGFIIAE